MRRNELIGAWIIGLTLGLEQIIAFKLFAADLYAFFPFMAIFIALSFIKDKDGENIYFLIRKAVGGKPQIIKRRRRHALHGLAK